MEERETNLYLLLGEMKGMLSTALSGLESMKEDHKEHKEAIDDRLNGHSERITKVEQFQWRATGIGIAIAAIPTAILVAQVFFIK